MVLPIITVDELFQITSGQNGYVFIADTDDFVGDFRAIQVVAEATFATLTDEGLNADGEVMTGVAIPAGTTLYGKFSAITLTSGKVIAYGTGNKLTE